MLVRPTWDCLRAAEALHRLILDRSGDVVIRLAVEGDIRYASPSVEQMWGYRPDELAGVSALAFVMPDDLGAVMEARASALNDPKGGSVAEYRLRRKDGSLVWVESHMRATADDDGVVTGPISILREVTERRHVAEELERRAATDPLTGLSNRRSFEERFGANRHAGTSGCLALFDLDHFKRVNDRFGHATGDEVLRRFAAVLRASVRDGDLAARLGGEEFVVILSGATLLQAQEVCERIRVRLANTVFLSPGREKIQVTVSAGLAALSDDLPGDAILAHADAALYRAKREGRNRLALAA